LQIPLVVVCKGQLQWLIPSENNRCFSQPLLDLDKEIIQSQAKKTLRKWDNSFAFELES